MIHSIVNIKYKKVCFHVRAKKKWPTMKAIIKYCILVVFHFLVFIL